MIIFKKIKFKNFGSFGNTFTEINLEKEKTTLICGKNGSGKSFAMLDSLTFALFGKPFRKINIPQLQNSINKKECVVELYFTIGSDSYKIRRGLAPKVFEIYKNDSLINQDAKASDYQQVLEDQILKMNYKTFTQVVILGSSSFVPFMQLSAADRRAVIENILDINIFATMNTIVKSKISEIKENAKDVNYSLEIHKTKIDGQNKLIKLSQQSVGINIDELKEKLENIKNQKTDMIRKYTIDSDVNKVYKNDEKKLSDLVKMHQKNIDQNTFKMEQLNEEKEFYDKETSCPKCKGKITDETKKENIKKIKETIQILQKENLYSEKSKEELQTQIERLPYKDTKETEAAITRLEYEISTLNKDIERYEKTNTDIETHKKELNQLLEELNVLMQSKAKLDEELEYYNYAYDLLKDSGVKAKIIKYYLPAMNKFINKYLSSMNFFIKFSLDEEFNESIKSRYRDEFSYMNFSEGEKMRIDLALLLSWREIAKLKNSVNCNLLILDEVFDSSLDSVGTDDVIRLLNVVGNNANVFVISHKADQIADKFKNILSFEKKGNFSKLVK
jgi:DNA repair exonuclease SbcCD ATPase subunit